MAGKATYRGTILLVQSLLALNAFRMLFSTRYRVSSLHFPPLSVETASTGTKGFPRVLLLKAPAEEISRAGVERAIQREYELPKIIREFGKPGLYRPPQQACTVANKWQNDMHPNCGTVHELDIFGAIRNKTVPGSYNGLGGTRETWQLQVDQQELAVKTLRLDKDYIWSRMNNQRIDATISEHLTPSPHVVDIYGYCGTVSINEFGIPLDKYVRQEELTFVQRLELARNISYGMAAVHAAHMVQHDVKAPNVLVANGMAKTSDFNNVHLELANKGKKCDYNFNSSCRKMMDRIKPRPEECSPKIGGRSTSGAFEVFQLGFILHFLLVPEEYREAIVNPPKMPPSLVNSTDPAVRVLRKAVETAFSVKASKRPSAKQIGDFLADALEKIKG